MDYNEVADLMLKIQRHCDQLTTSLDQDGFVSFYMVKKGASEGYLKKTNFKFSEIEGLILTLEKILKIFEKKSEKTNLAELKDTTKCYLSMILIHDPTQVSVFNTDT